MLGIPTPERVKVIDEKVFGYPLLIAGREDPASAVTGQASGRPGALPSGPPFIEHGLPAKRRLAKIIQQDFQWTAKFLTEGIHRVGCNHRNKTRSHQIGGQEKQT